MKKILFKRILGVIILSLAFLIPNVYACDDCTFIGVTGELCVPSKPTLSYGKLFGMKVKRLGGGQFEISINPKTDNSTYLEEARNTVFKITRINNTPMEGSITVKYNEPVIISGSFLPPGSIRTSGGKTLDGMVSETFYIELATVNPLEGALKDNLYQDVDTSLCTTHLMLSYAVTGGDSEPEVVPTTVDLAGIDWGVNSNFVSCGGNNYSPEKDVFLYNYCRIRNAAGVTNPADAKYKISNVNRNVSLKCDPNKINTKEKTDADYDYYVNKNYYYVTKTETKTVGQYEYNLDCNGTKGTPEPIQCERTCDEAVEVEYGPPIASKAGLCFEYKVKITSYTTCHSTEPNPPHPPGFCTPNLYCDNPTYGIISTGGPNEEFDSCVNSCDGGKYTSSCTNKCYKSVYGESILRGVSMTRNTTTKKSVSTTDDVATQKLASTCSGCHFSYSGGSIVWGDGSGSCGLAPAGNYDCSNWSFCPYNPAFVPDRDGIPRSQFATSYPDGICHDVCYFGGCHGTYLVQDNIQSDMEANKKKLQEAISTCRAQASCTKETATFSIEVDYSYDEKGKEKKVTIEFPYSTGKDKLVSPEGKGNSTGEGSTILDYNGCYKENLTTAWYRSEWSFPGTWINNKTGDISYQPRTDTGWTKDDKKFCIPFNAKDVNQTWWNFYMNQKLKDAEVSMNDSKYEDECNKQYQTVKSQTTFTWDNNRDKWNIRAIAEKFGHYKWNFNISCFYALNHLNSVVNNEIESGEEKYCTGKENYRIRTVSLDDVFPNEKGIVTVDYKETGRTPGFNWSKYSEQKEGNIKNPIYNAKPSDYTKIVQCLKYSVYSNDYLDYQFELTPQTLKQLRSWNNDKTGYTTFNGKTAVRDDGVVHYKSLLFRNEDGTQGGKLAGIEMTVPSWSLTSICNNIDKNKCLDYKNFSFDKCE